MKFTRLHLTHEADICASAEDAWDLLLDWAGLLRWWPEDAPFKIEQCDLVGEHGRVPRTREVHPGGGLVVPETLLVQDDEAKRIYYNMGQNPVINVRNYLATTTVDATGPDTCHMIFSSHSDVDENTDPEPFKAGILTVYSTIESGFNRYFSARKKQLD